MTGFWSRRGETYALRQCFAPIKPPERRRRNALFLARAGANNIQHAYMFVRAPARASNRRLVCYGSLSLSLSFPLSLSLSSEAARRLQEAGPLSTGAVVSHFRM